LDKDLSAESGSDDSNPGKVKDTNTFKIQSSKKKAYAIFSI
jgi:hypothetical protein